MTFDDWFYELEGFSFRSEWFWTDYENQNREAMLEWLKTAYEMGYNDGKNCVRETNVS